MPPPPRPTPSAVEAWRSRAVLAAPAPRAPDPRLTALADKLVAVATGPRLADPASKLEHDPLWSEALAGSAAVLASATPAELGVELRFAIVRAEPSLSVVEVEDRIARLRPRLDASARLVAARAMIAVAAERLASVAGELSALARDPDRTERLAGVLSDLIGGESAEDRLAGRHALQALGLEDVALDDTAAVRDALGGQIWAVHGYRRDLLVASGQRLFVLAAELESQVAGAGPGYLGDRAREVMAIGKIEKKVTHAFAGAAGVAAHAGGGPIGAAAMAAPGIALAKIEVRRASVQALAGLTAPDAVDRARLALGLAVGSAVADVAIAPLGRPLAKALRAPEEAVTLGSRVALEGALHAVEAFAGGGSQGATGPWGGTLERLPAF